MSASPKLVTRKNGMIYVHWTDNAGKLQRKSCVTKDRRVARERMAEIVAGGWSAPIAQEKAASAKAKGREVTAENVTMAHLFDRCKATCWTPAKARSQSTIASICRILTPMIGDGPVTAMTYGRLEALASELRARGYAEATVDRKLSAIGAALTQAYKESDAQGRPWLIAKPVTPSFKADNYRDRVMSAVEERLVFDAIAERARTEPLRNWRRFGYLIRFLLDTGCRKGEALTMLNDDRHLMTQYVERLKRHQTFAVFYKTKNGKFRSIPLSTEICESLSWLKDNAVEGKLFPYAPGSVNYMWSNIRKDVKSASGTDIKDVTLHTLRLTCISRKAQRQGSKGDIHKISL